MPGNILLLGRNGGTKSGHVTPQVPAGRLARRSAAGQPVLTRGVLRPQDSSLRTTPALASATGDSLPFARICIFASTTSMVSLHFPMLLVLISQASVFISQASAINFGIFCRKQRSRFLSN